MSNAVSTQLIWALLILAAASAGGAALEGRAVATDSACITCWPADNG